MLVVSRRDIGWFPEWFRGEPQRNPVVVPGEILGLTFSVKTKIKFVFLSLQEKFKKNLLDKCIDKVIAVRFHVFICFISGCCL